MTNPPSRHTFRHLRPPRRKKRNPFANADAPVVVAEVRVGPNLTRPVTAAVAQYLCQKRGLNYQQTNKAILASLLEYRRRMP
jgi:hypothetical protein